LATFLVASSGITIISRLTLRYVLKFIVNQKKYELYLYRQITCLAFVIV
jgi:hypothetical protein